MVITVGRLIFKHNLPATFIGLPAFFLAFAWIGVSWYTQECSDTATALTLIQNHQVVEMHRNNYNVTFVAVYEEQTVMGVKQSPNPPALAVRVPLRDVKLLENYIAQHPQDQIGDNVRTKAPFHYDDFGFINAFEHYGI
jgi:hypothetical protein